MNTLTLHMQNKSGITMISNTFIDEYMAEANGEFVKIYLYLLRCVNSNLSLSITAIADKFNNTEADILRALKYWEKMNILVLKYAEDNSLSDVCFLDFNNASTESVTEATTLACAVTNESSQLNVKEKKIPSYSADQIKEFQSQAEIKQLLFVAESYMGKTLSVTEINNILYFYDELHFSADLIEYLIEYCVSKGSKSINYMRATALAWDEQEITTVLQAKSATTAYSKYCFTIFNAFGIKGRNPVDFEVKMIDKWINTYCFTLDIIFEAISRTLKQAHKPSFEYADSILTKWHDSGIKHKDDIAKLDAVHQANKTAKTQANNKQPVKETANKNKFNNFHQRNYDFDKLEKQLLNIK